jgi:hypothetical protein
MTDCLLLVLLFCVAYPAGYHIGRALARALLPLIYLGIAAIVTWVCVALVVLWQAIVFAIGMAWDWIRD